MIRWNGYYLYLSGKSDKQIEVRNAVPLCLSQKWVSYVKKLEKTVEDGFLDKNISREKNEELYEILLQKHCCSIYAKKPNPVGKKLQKGQPLFHALQEQQQAEVLMQLLQLTQLANLKVDLSLIGGDPKGGKLKINKNISGTEEFVLINQSPAGLYETEIDLKTI